jgi:hypothetical protein
MYAFGDDPNPLPESVAVLEDIMTEYVNEMVLSSFPSLSLNPVCLTLSTSFPEKRWMVLGQASVRSMADSVVP